MRHWLLIISFIGYTLGMAQTQEFIYKNLDIGSGLSQNTVMSIHQDKQGFIWLGTYDGVNKFDGKEVVQFVAQNNSSLTISNSSVYDICGDYKNNVYIATEGGGVNVYNPVTEQFSIISDQNPELKLFNNYVTRLCSCTDSTIWITTRKGIAIYSAKENSIRNYPINTGKANSLPNFEPSRIIEDKKHTRWIGTKGGGLLRYRPVTDDFVLYYNKANGSDSYDYNIINSLVEIDDSSLIIGTLKGAYLFNKNTGTFSKYLNISDEIVATLIDSENAIWIGTANNGIFYKSKNKPIKQFKHNPYNLKSLAENQIKSLYEDNNKNIWIGFMSKGVSWFSLEQKKFYHFYHIPDKNSIVDNNVFCIEEDHQQNVWIGTTKGITIWNRKDNIFNTISANKTNSIKNDRVWEILYDQNNSIWIGGLNGIDIYNIESNTFKNYRFIYNDSTSIPSDAVFAIEKDKNGDIWIGTFTGIAKYDNETDNFKCFISTDSTKFLSDNLVWDILSDSKGRLWIATLNGLNRYNFETNSFQEVALKNSKLENNNLELTYLSEDTEGYIWVSSRTGLIKYDPETKNSTVISMADGLPSNNVLGHVEHNDYLWIASNKGLSKMHKFNHYPNNYGISDGLQSYEFNVATEKLHDGLVMFGGINGISAFYPDMIKASDQTPKIVFSDLELNGSHITPMMERYGKTPLEKSITFTNSVALSYKEKLVSVDFVAIDFAATDKIKYAYRVLPNSSEWIPLDTKNSVTFTNLAPGNYTLQVKSTNSEQVFCDNTKSLEIIIVPPFWKQTWFYIFEILLLFMFVYLYSYIRNRMIQKTNRRLELTVSERTEEILSQKEEIEAQRNMANEQRDKIAEQKEKLEKFNEILEEKVQQRTQELIIAKEKAEESDRLKSAFLSNMSHEIRTPLNAIIGFSDILLVDHIDLDKKNQYIELIKTNGRTLLNLLNDIIDISIIESGQLKVCYEKTNLFNLVNAIFISFKDNCLKESNAVQFIFHPDLNEDFIVNTDNLRLIQILNNLLNNATKYTRAGSISLRYKIHNECVHFIVADTGIGMSEEESSKVFNRFHKVDDQKTKTYRGGGLGLAICKNLTEALGGDIWVNSKKGSGSEFHFTISTCLVEA